MIDRFLTAVAKERQEAAMYVDIDFSYVSNPPDIRDYRVQACLSRHQAERLRDFVVALLGETHVY